MAILEQLLPILILLGVVGIVLWRLPKVDVGHSPEFMARRRMNWISLGLCYAFLYFGRYNLSVAKTELGDMGLMTNESFGTIFFWGSIVYGLAFLINGPLCDRVGGRKTIIFALAGSAIANALMGGFLLWGKNSGLDLTLVFTILYSINMYFQSFGAVSIVKVNSAWFHVRERGVLGGIFGILISLGLYFAYDWNGIILKNIGVEFVFGIPAITLVVCFVLAVLCIRDTPSKAGLQDFNTGDATSGESSEPEEEDKSLGGAVKSVLTVFKKMVTNPVILTIACIEFCSGFCRNGIMQWGPTFAKLVPMHTEEFVFANWGLVSCCAGILSGIFAGVISDYCFKSRRGPVAAILYSGMLVGCISLFFILDTPIYGWMFAFMSLCIIGVHGMLSGTASMDFGGSKNAGVATGMIDACVYLGSGLQAFILGRVLPDKGDALADHASNWSEFSLDSLSDFFSSLTGGEAHANWFNWPIALMPFILIGLVLSFRIWGATVEKKKTESSETLEDSTDTSNENEKAAIPENSSDSDESTDSSQNNEDSADIEDSHKTSEKSDSNNKDDENAEKDKDSESPENPSPDEP